MQIPCLVRMSRAALEEGKCVVIGLQSTGEARTADVVAERGEILEDYVSGPRVLLASLSLLPQLSPPGRPHALPHAARQSFGRAVFAFPGCLVLYHDSCSRAI